MQLYSQHSEFFDQPIRLTEEEKKDPLQVINFFFGAHHLHEIRQILWNLFETSITTDNHMYDESRERDKLLCFYQQLETMLEAAYVVDQMTKPKENIKRKKKKKNKMPRAELQ